MKVKVIVGEKIHTACHCSDGQLRAGKGKATNM